MADDQMDAEAKPGTNPAKAKPKNPPLGELEKLPPEDWPPYKDPKGRKITNRQFRRAKRAAAALGIETLSNNHAMHLAAHYGIDPFEVGSATLLSVDINAAADQESKRSETSDAKPAGTNTSGAAKGARAAKGKDGQKAKSGKGDAKAVGKAPAATAKLPARTDDPGNAVALMDNDDDHNMMVEAKTSPTPAKPEPKAQTKPNTISAAEREAEIKRIQKNLIKRRRRRFMAMMLRLFICVGLPTALVGYYLYNIATPMYETESEFVIQTSESGASAGGLGGLLAGTGFATSQDSVVVQGYLGSREAFLRLNREFDYVNHFQQENIDVIQRLPRDATLDEAYAYFRDRVSIGYDPTEGIIRMTVVAANPQTSQRFAEALVGYAEQRVDGLTQEARGDQLIIAEERYQEAEQAMLDAERRVLALQQQRGVLSADVELSSQMSIISNLELELEKERLILAEMLANSRPNVSRVEVQEQKIARLSQRIGVLRGDLTSGGQGDSSVSLARISGELRVAESELATRHLILQESIAAMEASRLEASRQVRFLSLGVAPVAPVEATYPRKLESTVLAFVVFMGIYILASLTVSILREQVSV